MGFLRQALDRDKARDTPPDLAHAALVVSTIPKDMIRFIDSMDAETIPGVVAIITHRTLRKVKDKGGEKPSSDEPRSDDRLGILKSPEISFGGQSVAVIIAETSNQAREAASLICVAYESETLIAETDADRPPPTDVQSKLRQKANQTERGDVERALRQAAITATYSYFRKRVEEPRATIAVWDGNRLTLHDKTQWVAHDLQSIADELGVWKENIRIISDMSDGKVGHGPRAWPHATIAAAAARHVNRPVSLELTEHEICAVAGLWLGLEQRITLAATRDGKLQAILHQSAAETSVLRKDREQGEAETTLEPVHLTYSCANIRTSHQPPVDQDNEGWRKPAPAGVTSSFALETAMDELATVLRIDPIELRLRNYAERDEHRNLPWFNKELRSCYDVACERFAWNQRSLEPRSMRDGCFLIGYGMATAICPLGPENQFLPNNDLAYSNYVFGAVFAEVRVNSGTGAIRVARLVAAFDIGTSGDYEIASRQSRDGMARGVDLALGKDGGFNSAEEDAHTPRIEALFVPRDGRLRTPLKMPELSEIGVRGVVPAIANAVFHATGMRVRDLPIQLREGGSKTAIETGSCVRDRLLTCP